jgi:hypothetical protein
MKGEKGRDGRGHNREEEVGEGDRKRKMMIA